MRNPINALDEPSDESEQAPEQLGSCLKVAYWSLASSMNNDSAYRLNQRFRSEPSLRRL